MLIEKYLSTYHFNTLQTLTVSSTPANIYSHLWTADFSKSLMIVSLFKLRGMPHRAFTLNGLIKTGFILLEENTGQELVLGFVGQPWKLKGNLLTIHSDKFTSFSRKGFVKVVWNFQLTPIDSNTTRIATETRIYCMDRAAKYFFTAYWLLISPFSRLIRRHMLQVLKDSSKASFR